MNNSGFIQLPRKIREWTWYGKLNTRAVFLHILLGAAWEDKTVNGIKIRRGQFLTTVKDLAFENELSVQQTRTALERLKKTNDITIETSTQFSIITVNNYDALTSCDKPNNKQITNEQQTFQQTNNKPTLLNNNTRKEEAEEAAGCRPQFDLENRRRTSDSNIETFNENNKAEAAATAAKSTELVAKVVGEYNAVCKSLPSIQPNIAVRHKAELISKAAAIMGDMPFEELFSLVEQSDFLSGRSGRFKANFDWILKPDNLAKIVSGAYSENYGSAKAKSVPSAADYEVPLYD